MERIDATGVSPGVEGQVIRLARSKLDGIFLERLRQHMPIFGHDGEGMSMYMHGVHHRRIRTNQADMNGLAVLDHDRLGIRKALAVDDKPATGHHAHEFSILHVGMNSLLCLCSSWAWVHNECSVEATRYLSD